MSDQLAEVKYQNELARIDREWEIEREQYLVSDRYGQQHVPTPGISTGVAILGGLFGVFWTILATSIAGAFPRQGAFGIAKVLLPLFGVFFTVAAISYGLYCRSKAKRYLKAFEKYKARRAGVKPK